jgi:hypothetical protein
MSEKESPAETLRHFADRIDLQRGEFFGGALVFLPPGSVEPKTLFLVTEKADEELYWFQVQTLVNKAIEEFNSRKAQFRY